MSQQQAKFRGAVLKAPFIEPDSLQILSAASKKSGGIDQVLRRVDLAEELSTWRKNPKLATVVLGSLARSSRPGEAARVLKLMQEGQVQVDAFHYSAAMTACARGGGLLWELALDLLHDMPERK
ncbi:unnamed protein product, partial [Polarella glacialis]